MAEYLTKAAFGRRHARAASTVSRWIKTGKLSPPALRPNGLVDAEMGDKQLALRLDMTRGRPPTTLPERPAFQVPAAQQAQTELLAARALSASIGAERARRLLDAERGKYVIAEDVFAVIEHTLLDYFTAVEASFPDLAADLGLNPHQARILRRWWQTRRERAEANARNMRHAPPFVRDAARAH
jgi:hypothetical protein